MVLSEIIKSCVCCGSTKIAFNEVLWKSLTDEWRLSSYEIDYINRQQGLHCLDCSSNLRSMALALAIMKFFGYRGIFKNFVKTENAQKLKILEINTAGSLTQYLSQMPEHHLKGYPEVDMMEMPFANESFDLVVHSDTLEHIAYPVRGLTECYRVLTEQGVCAFTVPIIVDRLTISRAGLPASYHGACGGQNTDLVVHTEYGCDAWKHIIKAGFQECRITSIEYPAAQALVAVK